jgi:hypothetical protein
VLREELVAELSKDPRTGSHSSLIYTGIALVIVTLSSRHSASCGYYPRCGDSAGQEHIRQGVSKRWGRYNGHSQRHLE